MSAELKIEKLQALLQRVQSRAAGERVSGEVAGSAALVAEEASGEEMLGEPELQEPPPISGTAVASSEPMRGMEPESIRPESVPPDSIRAEAIQTDGAVTLRPSPPTDIDIGGADIAGSDVGDSDIADSDIADIDIEDFDDEIIDITDEQAAPTPEAAASEAPEPEGREQPSSISEALGKAAANPELGDSQQPAAPTTDPGVGASHVMATNLGEGMADEPELVARTPLDVSQPVAQLVDSRRSVTDRTFLELLDASVRLGG